MDASRFPLDYEALKKGDTIPAARVEKIAGVLRGSEGYEFAVLKVCKQIERELAVRERLWTVVVRGEDVVILTDAQAATYTDDQQRQAMRRLKRNFHRQVAVDVLELSEEERAKHERAVEVNGKTLQAAMTARRKAMRITAHERSTPKLA